MSYQLPKHIRHLCIEGVIGSGKTSLSTCLAEHLHCDLLLEDFTSNPFLEKFYKNQKNYAFQTQIMFLLSRYKQLSENFTQQDLFKTQIISDYILEKDNIFANINLSEHELKLYYDIANLVNPTVSNPDYVIYLQTDPDVLLERIQYRKRFFEKEITLSYIKEICEHYNSFFAYYSKSPLLIINTNDIDFVNHPKDLDLLLSTICKAPDGVNYFSPSSQV